MRLWTINFKYLDAKGLVALWREALLAKNVLAGLTKGYKNHPQLDRFYAHENAQAAINAYLAEIYAQACARGYKFDAAKVGEFDERNLSVKNIEIASIFKEIEGGIEPWEKVKILRF